MYQESDIVYETKDFWVLRDDIGYKVFQKGISASSRVALFAFRNEYGLKRAIDDCNNRQTKYNSEI